MEEESKSAKKRQAKYRLDIGAKIIALNADQLAGLSLPEDVLRAVADHHRFTSREARRRQLHYIGKLLRKIDIEVLETELLAITGESAAARAEHHKLEQWRERLLTEDGALTEYLADHPACDKQHLRHLIKRSKSARDERQRTRTSRALYRFLREQSQQQSRSD